tara:strand:+ start:385 stop:765 length:381 start_codon:yes stop_codon:yes gene_type:complete
MNKIIIIFLILSASCYKIEENKEPIDLSFLETHAPDIKNGRKIFNQSCITCHLYGTGGANILNDKISWNKMLNNRDKKDIYLNVLNGFLGEKGPMPSKGACINCSNTDLLDAIEYILSVNNLSINN